MKLIIGTVATVSSVVFALSMASANPSLLPKHEGYPMKNSGDGRNSADYELHTPTPLNKWWLEIICFQL